MNLRPLVDQIINSAYVDPLTLRLSLPPAPASARHASEAAADGGAEVRGEGFTGLVGIMVNLDEGFTAAEHEVTEGDEEEAAHEGQRNNLTNLHLTQCYL